MKERTRRTKHVAALALALLAVSVAAYFGFSRTGRVVRISVVNATDGPLHDVRVTRSPSAPVITRLEPGESRTVAVERSWLIPADQVHSFMYCIDLSFAETQGGSVRQVTFGVPDVRNGEFRISNRPSPPSLVVEGAISVPLSLPSAREALIHGRMPRSTIRLPKVTIPF